MTSAIKRTGIIDACKNIEQLRLEIESLPVIEQIQPKINQLRLFCDMISVYQTYLVGLYIRKPITAKALANKLTARMYDLRMSLKTSCERYASYADTQIGQELFALIHKATQCIDTIENVSFSLEYM